MKYQHHFQEDLPRGLPSHSDKVTRRTQGVVRFDEVKGIQKYTAEYLESFSSNR